ncbi:hypothetical protein EMIHUDRAFT_252995 [Emiliania huxleyi CCMP1516]|uniref:Amino acid permease/ SLC12A domain-containing protein n=2 Tax=Emiliania huxleyi TaxID=2903 RepID=A0A0D3KDR0_EMIH1|nr:hypothetical protein EMIHUDRAFT_252995 [Emiliania huxleyi CCMP1516]EOD33895.1 hypothetical protein EMIHUDRAFT_252995 [Emiliania huxleyi CCMP1516]|eukprot:XP_005786324.1 hypothetical protein EMIHUDRAFT_252995 [Emiliania huxleyi CCMP1516]
MLSHVVYFTPLKVYGIDPLQEHPPVVNKSSHAGSERSSIATTLTSESAPGVAPALWSRVKQAATTPAVSSNAATPLTVRIGALTEAAVAPLGAAAAELASIMSADVRFDPDDRRNPGYQWDMSPSLPPRWRWLALRAGRSLNRAALPFLRDADLNDDDYELQPPKPKLEMLQLMGIAFFAVSGSAYGVEEIVPLGGPFLSLAALVIAPAVWSAPMLLVTAELSVALPRAGGYVVWVEEALGAMPSLLNAMANLACSVLDCSLHPAAAHAELAEAGSAGGAEGVALAVVRVLLVALAAALNVRGVDVVGSAAGVLMLLALDPDPRLWPSGREAWFSFLCIVLWNCCGYDSAGMVAAEALTRCSARRWVEVGSRLR